jgi:hypothetical protein
MSMDLSVWSSRPFELPGELPLAASWVRYPEQWVFESGAWQVLVTPAQRSERDRPNEAVLHKVPDASHVAYVTLEPIGADQHGYGFLEEVVRALARASAGFWVDPWGEPFAHDEGQFE